MKKAVQQNAEFCTKRTSGRGVRSIISLLAIALCCAAALIARPAPLTGQPEEAAKTAAEKAAAWQKSVEEITGLKFKKPPSCAPVNDEEMQKVLQKQVERYLSEEELKSLLQTTALFDPEMSKVDGSAALKLISQLVTGVYVPEEKKYYYLGKGGEAAESRVAIHELTHALQDQHFDLAKFLNPELDNIDRLEARRALTEGEATCVETEQELRQKGKSLVEMKEDVGLMQAPLFGRASMVQKLFLFPYSGGSSFYQAYLKKNGWGKSTDLYKNPPSSTEQILHEQKFVSGMDYPVEIDFSLKASDLGRGWEKSLSTTLGEFCTIAFLGANQKDEIAAWKAAIGWDGDRWTFFRNTADNSCAAAALTLWDSEDDAKEFLAFIKGHFINRWKDALTNNETKFSEEADASYRWLTKDRAFFLKRDGSKVLVGINLPLDSEEKALKALSNASFTFDKNDKDKGARDAETTREAQKATIEKIKARLEPKVEGKLIPSKTGRCSLNLKEGDWTMMHNPGTPSVTLIFVSNKALTGNISIAETAAPDLKDLDAVMKEMKTVFPQVVPNFKIISEEDTTLDGVKAKRVVFQYDNAAMTVKAAQVIALKDGVLYSLTYASDIKEFETLEKLAKPVAETFKFIAKQEGDKIH